VSDIAPTSAVRLVTFELPFHTQGDSFDDDADLYATPRRTRKRAVRKMGLGPTRQAQARDDYRPQCRPVRPIEAGHEVTHSICVAAATRPSDAVTNRMLTAAVGVDTVRLPEFETTGIPWQSR
jgi:hypothetical protein